MWKISKVYSEELTFKLKPEEEAELLSFLWGWSGERAKSIPGIDSVVSDSLLRNAELTHPPSLTDKESIG